MGIALYATMVLVVSVAVALAVVVLLGMRRHASAAVRISAVGLALAGATILVQVLVPLIDRWPPYLLSVAWTDYFLAMAHFFNQSAPYPFFWTPHWIYQVGVLTPLVFIGGVTAFAFGAVARRAGARAGLATSVIGLGVTAVYVELAVAAAFATWHGVPV